MASTTRRLVLSTSRSCSRISSRKAAPQHSIQWQRPLSTTAPLRVDHPPKEKTAIKPGRSSPPAPEGTVKVPASKTRAPRPNKKTPQEVRAMQMADLTAELEAMNPENIAQAERAGQLGLPWGDERIKLERDEDFEIQATKGKPGFWAEGEPAMGPDEDYYGDDITSHGHGELEMQREIRHYARLIAWELPLLNQLARPFELPTAKQPFRFRYTSYLGESHPAANKVVVEFCASDMPNLSQIQKDKFIKLAGPRYNPSTDVIKMSCEMFDTQAQNKRSLGDTISKLLAEARDGKDTFVDVPFDFRHHKPKVRHEFPKEWIMTPERKKYLEEKRQKLLQLDEEKTENGEIVDGQKIIENSLPFNAPVAEPVMVSGPRGKQLR